MCQIQLAHASSPFDEAEEVDVVLLNPGNLKAVYQDLGVAFSAIEPPSLAALFTDYLRRKGLSVRVIDAPALNLAPQQAAALLHENFSARLIVLVVYGFQPSASTQNMTAAGETCAAIKALRGTCQIMMTGTHPAALPERTIRGKESISSATAKGQRRSC